MRSWRLNWQRESDGSKPDNDEPNSLAVLKAEVHCRDCGAKLEASDKMCPKCGSRGYRYSIAVEDSAETFAGVQTKQRDSAAFLRKVLKSWSERARRTVEHRRS